ncbi:MAG: YggS family pyridoxal phosphate-dependent enzyme [Bacteroidetes bacterium]|nr:MAG: YggS family pyridoxal phosphate-dependent enzyme [Bacteroidota bacterium]
MTIREKYLKLKESLPENVTLVAVSKTKPVEDILQVYECGHRDFGENKVQEMVAKYEQLPKDIRWHMIGHLQTNKVKYIAPFVHLIHSVDSEKLLKEIDKRAKQNRRIIDVLLQIHIAQEETKFGLDFQEAGNILNNAALYSNVKISGLMGMATYTNDENQIANEFSSLHRFFKQMQTTYPSLQILSMGMSNDYPIALKHGSNMIRVGSAIFGERKYT